MMIQFKVFTLALLLYDFVPLCSLLSSVAIVQAGCGGWLVWYLSRPSTTVIGRLGKK